MQGKEAMRQQKGKQNRFSTHNSYPFLDITSLDSNHAKLPSPLQESYQQQRNRLALTNIQLCQGQGQYCLQTAPLKMIADCFPLPEKQSNELSHMLLLDDFPVLSCSASVKMLRSSQFGRISFGQKTVRRLVQQIAGSYLAVPYHNFSHAFSLTLLSYQCLAKQFSLKYLYTEEEYFYILVAGLAHDLGHNGTNNAFQVKSGTPLAKETQGVAVLEHMHLRKLWNLLGRYSDINFLQYAQDPTKGKEIITRLILSTDMSNHYRNFEHFQNIRSQLDPKRNPQHKWLLMEQIFHGCDIGNSCLDYSHYLTWSALLAVEFNQQAKLEEKNGLEVTKGFQLNDVASFYKDQVWFVGNLVQPLWKEIVIHCPALTHFLDKIASNLEKVIQESDKLRQ